MDRLRLVGIHRAVRDSQLDVKVLIATRAAQMMNGGHEVHCKSFVFRNRTITTRCAL